MPWHWLRSATISFQYSVKGDTIFSEVHGWVQSQSFQIAVTHDTSVRNICKRGSGRKSWCYGKQDEESCHAERGSEENAWVCVQACSQWQCQGAGVEGLTRNTNVSVVRNLSKRQVFRKFIHSKTWNVALYQIRCQWIGIFQWISGNAHLLMVLEKQ